MTHANPLAGMAPDRIRGEINKFRELISGVPYEPKGILYSEMFFFWMLARDCKPGRILESGRARGQSTLILSLCFPNCEIVSVEFDEKSPDVAIASERLRDRANVSLRFGDATKLLPAIALSSDVAIIDGPKGYRGLRLAARLLRSGLPMVFVHDTSIGSPERRFLQRRCPEALYSDTVDLARETHVLDVGASDNLGQEHRWQGATPPVAGYGYSLACLPRSPHRSYSGLLAYAVIDGLRYRLRERA